MPYGYDDDGTQVFESQDDPEYITALKMARDSQAAFGSLGDKSPQVQLARSRGAGLPDLTGYTPAAASTATSPSTRATPDGGTYNAYGNVPQSLPELSQDIEYKKLARQLAVAQIQQKIDSINDQRNGLPPRGSAGTDGSTGAGGIDPTQGGTITKYVGPNGPQNAVSVADANAPTVDTSTVSQEMINPDYVAAQKGAEQAREDKLTGFNKGAQAAQYKAAATQHAADLKSQEKAISDALKTTDPSKHAEAILGAQKYYDSIDDQVGQQQAVIDQAQDDQTRAAAGQTLSRLLSHKKSVGELLGTLKSNAGVTTQAAPGAPAGTSPVANNHSVSLPGGRVVNVSKNDFDALNTAKNKGDAKAIKAILGNY